MKLKTLFPALLVLQLLHTSCVQAPQQKADTPDAASYLASQETGVRDGGVEMITVNTPRGDFKVWTKRIGNNPRIKLLLLHGGPGMSHQYFECMESFLPAEGIEFIYYDQLGSAFSDKPNDTSLWVTERFVEELEQVRKALDLGPDNFYLLGHSWGGILAMEYALKYQRNLKGLIISNMMASAPEYDQYAEKVLAPQIDPKVLDTLRQIEARKDFANPKYMELLMPHFYNQHILRLPLDEWPEPVNRAFATGNQQVYVTMQGPSEFGISGRLETWDRKADLPNIVVPTLVIGATHDTMDPGHMKWMSTAVQNGSFLLCPNGSHMCMWDDQQTYMNGIIKFMKETDAGKKKVEL